MVCPKQTAAEPRAVETSESSPDVFGATAAFGGEGAAGDGGADPFATPATGRMDNSDDDTASTASASAPQSQANAPSQAEDDFFGSSATTVGFATLGWPAWH